MRFEQASPRWAQEAYNGVDELLSTQFLSQTLQSPINQPADLPGLEKHIKVDEPGVLGVVSQFTFKHPHPKFIEAYQKLACDIAQEIIISTESINTETISETDKNYIMPRIADYYRTQIIALPFETVNNSILMVQVNYLLSRLKLNPIPHRAFDFEATGLSHKQWRSRFLKILNTESNLPST